MAAFRGSSRRLGTSLRNLSVQRSHCLREAKTAPWTVSTGCQTFKCLRGPNLLRSEVLLSPKPLEGHSLRSSMGGPSLFAQYEDEYCNKRTDIQRKINAIQSLGADLRRQRTSEADNDIRDAEGMIKRMDMEARSLPASHAQGLLAKVKEYKLSLAALKEQLQQAIAAPSSGDAARAELGLGVEYHTTTTGSQRERMLLATQRMEKTSERLANGKRMLAETETAGQATLAELQRQRQVIQHSAATLRGVQPDLKQSENSLSSMQSWFGW